MVNDSMQRPSPEQILADIECEERRKRRGRLKVFLGYAGGVGKSFQMLDEGRRRRDRGEDVLVCALQPEYPPEVQEILEKLEIIPLLKTGDAESIDVPAVIHRHPQVVLIDGLAYNNPPGSPNAHRWEDVEQTARGGDFGHHQRQRAVSRKASERSRTHYRQARVLHDSLWASSIEAPMKSSSWTRPRRRAFCAGSSGRG